MQLIEFNKEFDIQLIENDTNTLKTNAIYIFSDYI